MNRRISATLLLEPQLNENYGKIKTDFYISQNEND